MHPTATPSSPLPTATQAYSTMDALRSAELPYRDLAELASRLRYGGTPIPQVVAEVPREWEVGDVDTFWIANVDTHEH